MSGGLIQLVSASNQDIVLTGNPSKTFFKSTYHKYTNFSLQKFRLDFEGAKTLRLSEESNFTFKVKRYADLLMDCYLSVDLPNIWSPIFPPNTDAASTENNSGAWIPYEFKWIENIGAQMISRITITCGNQTLQEYSGSYILAMAQRDFSAEKKALFDKMIGNVPELTNPANSGSRVNSYPNAYYTANPAGAEPSIRGRTLYIPLNSWFTMKSQMAFPLVALQYNELQIKPEDVIWIEAIPFKALEAQCRLIPNVYNAVISDKDDEDVVFNISNNIQSSSILQLETHAQEHPDVVYTASFQTKSVTLDTFFERNAIDPSKCEFWNFDIQGAELMALKGATRSIPYAKVIYLEVNEKELYKDCGMINEVDTFLSSYNFKRVITKVTKHGWGDAIYILDT
jgi:FkbM family methyltransferase